MPKFPDIEVELTGHDGNAFFILGKVKQALRQADASKEQLDEFHTDAISGDYDHLLQTCKEWVNFA